MNVSSSVEQGEHEHDNKHQGIFSKTEVIIKYGPLHVLMMMDSNARPFACVCQVLVIKQIKARKVENKVMDHHVDPMTMSSTFSFENFKHNSGIANEKNEDESISSYFELPISHMFKYSGDGH
ncbi:hypothetical protein TanjilG_23888 [Lupinus angustifolius]|uniref:Uncharacterized protein n=1 Tax=Lupinus angustifolius TaxID=3871 RepID=A0A1J7GGS1_LUPAN|nr:hypothetical protein TanjilG_23888 [Lupinus angustifolius]